MSLNLATNSTLKPRRGFFFRLAALLLLVIAVLGVLTVGSSTAAKTLFKPSNEPSGGLLYATGFDDPSDPNWEQYASAVTAKIADGKLQLIADQAKANIFAPLAFTYRDFDVRVVARQTLGTDPFSEYGVMFRLQDPKNYYVLRLRSDGGYSVWKCVNGVLEALSAATVPDFVPPPFTIGLNWANDLRVVGKGNQFQFFVNGKLLMLCPKGTDKRSTWAGAGCASNNKQTTQTLTDDSFSEGRIALVIYENDEKVAVEFDNLVIVAP
jgi:hypothetical protein